jgi:hypothetical protein
MVYKLAQISSEIWMTLSLEAKRWLLIVIMMINSLRKQPETLFYMNMEKMKNMTIGQLIIMLTQV